MRSIEPGISRFRVWSFGPWRKDDLRDLQPHPVIGGDDALRQALPQHLVIEVGMHNLAAGDTSVSGLVEAREKVRTIESLGDIARSAQARGLKVALCHGCLALYALLADRGFFPLSELDGFCGTDSILGGHPEYGKHNIRVNCIAPGLIKTDFAKALWDNPETLKASTARSPLLRIGVPDEIAGAAVLMGSKAGDFMTGQTVVIDGGATIS